MSRLFSYIWIFQLPLRALFEPIWIIVSCSFPWLEQFCSCLGLRGSLRSVCDYAVWINAYSDNQQNKWQCALTVSQGRFLFIILSYFFLSLWQVWVIQKCILLLRCFTTSLKGLSVTVICGWCSLKVNLCRFSFYLLRHVAERLDALRAQLWW